MTRASDVRRFLWLLRNYSAPYWWAVGLLLLTSYVGTALSALFPVLMAPILDLALGVPVGAGVSGTAPNDGLSLTNLGAAFFEWVGVRAVDDRFRAIVVLCLLYLAVGILKGIADFGNYLFGLWIRVRATGREMQRMVKRHHRNRRSEAQPCGTGRAGRDEHRRVGHRPSIGDEVVLGEPEALPAKFLSQLHVLHEVAVVVGEGRVQVFEPGRQDDDVEAHHASTRRAMSAV